jgi:chemotaxis protein MotB
MRTENERLADELARLQSERRKLQDELEASRRDAADRDRLMTEQADALRRIKGIEDQIGRSQQALDGSQDRIAALERQLADARRELEDLRNLRAREAQQHQAPLLALPPDTVRRLEDLERRNPEGFEFDAARSLAKFDTDILFDTGKDTLRPEARTLLADFANIVNGQSAQERNLLIVGHTDDRPVVRPETLREHRTNWHLSAHRAIAVEQFLQQSGVVPERMAVAGYGEYQPVVPNDSEDARQRNRRVEIYMLGPGQELTGRSEGRDRQ